MAESDAKPTVIDYPKFQINYKGEVYFQEWYKMLYDWLGRNGFKHAQTDDNLIEDYHSEIQVAGGALKNRWIWWRVAYKDSDMFHYVLDVDFQTLAMKDKEIMHNGHKIKINEGELSMFLTAKLVIDPPAHWQKNWIAKEVFDILKRKDFVEEIEYHKREFYDLIIEFHDRAKQSLHLATIEHREEPFIPLGGLPDI